MKVQISAEALDRLAQRASDTHTQCIFDSARQGPGYEALADMLKAANPGWEKLPEHAKDVWRNIAYAVACDVVAEVLKGMMKGEAETPV